MYRILLAVVLAGILLASTFAQEPGTTPRFTGASAAMDGKDLSVARRSFEAGARTYWHSHDNGQLLLVEKGRMRAQKRGQPMRELAAGDSDYTAPNVVHWHGAAPNEALVQVNVGFGGGSKWYEEVTPEQYDGKR